MNEYRKAFEQYGALYLGQILTKDECHEASQVLIESEKNNGPYFDHMVEYSSCFGDDELSYLNEKIQKSIEKILDINLYPTYNYSRIYRKGEILWPHNDREACEISITLTLGVEKGSVWPFYFLNKDDSTDYLKYFKNNEMFSEEKYKLPNKLLEKKQKVDILLCDGLLYKGIEIIHWRDEFVESNFQIQTFFHYVDANGPYKEHKCDEIVKGILNGRGD